MPLQWLRDLLSQSADGLANGIDDARADIRNTWEQIAYGHDLAPANQQVREIVPPSLDRGDDQRLVWGDIREPMARSEHAREREAER